MGEVLANPRTRATLRPKLVHPCMKASSRPMTTAAIRDVSPVKAGVRRTTVVACTAMPSSFRSSLIPIVPDTQPTSLVPCRSLAARLVFRHAASNLSSSDSSRSREEVATAGTPSDSGSPACRRWVNV